jgi:hypothetical protein
MPVLYPFRCANGHSFEANAKLRTRCPECGQMTRRSFKTGRPEEERPEPEPRFEESKLPEPEPRPEESKRPGPEPRPEERKRPVLIRQGRPRVATAKSQKPTPPASGKRTVSGGLVGKKRIASPGAHPRITTMPKKTAVARGIKARGAGHEETEVFWHKVAKKYGF